MVRKVVKWIAVFLILISIVAVFYIAAICGRVNLDKTKLVGKNTPSAFIDYSGKKIDYNLPEYIPYEKIPKNLINAFVSIEDKRFFDHNGIDILRILGATIDNLKSMSFKEGASTISQQLIKNTHLTNEKTINRKLKEAKLAIDLEKEYSKEQIIEMYLNIIYFGSNSYGIAEASSTFFNKKVEELNLSECAMLAGIVKNPAKYSPINNYENSTAREKEVLSFMHANGYISESEKINAENSKIIIKNSLNYNNYRLPYLNLVIDECCNILNISKKKLITSGYEIETYYDENCQKSISNTLSNKNFYAVNEFGNQSDSMAIIADNKTYGIKGFYSTFSESASSIKRQPGSSIKPLAVYAPALQNNLINLLTPILDEKTEFENGYAPDNYKEKYYGWVSPSFALAKSLNVPAVKILEELKIENSVSFLNSLNIKTDADDGLATALGGLTYGIGIKELCAGYMQIANSGKFSALRCVKNIYDINGKIIYSDEKNLETKQVMSPENAYLLTKMLKNAVDNGTASKLKDLNFDIAAKTGTVAANDRNFNTDAWCACFSTELTSVVWQGNLDGSKEKLLPSYSGGGTYPTMIAKQLMSQNIKSFKAFKKPDGIVELNIDKNALTQQHKVLLSTENTPEEFIIKEEFNINNLPKEFSPIVYHTENQGLSATRLKDRILLQFNGDNRSVYKLYKIINNEKLILDSFKTEDSLYSIYDQIPQNADEITYEIETYSSIFGIEFQNKPPFSITLKLKYPDESNDYKQEIIYKYYP